MSSRGSVAAFFGFVEEEVPLEFVVADEPVPGVGDIVRTKTGSYGRIVAEKSVNGAVGFSVRLLADMRTWWQEMRYVEFYWQGEVVLL